MESSKSDIRLTRHSGETGTKALDVIKGMHGTGTDLKQNKIDDSLSGEECHSENFNHKKKCYDEQLHSYEKAEQAVLSSGKDVDKIIASCNANIDNLSKLIDRNRPNCDQLAEEIGESTTKMEELKEQADLKTAEIARIREERDTDKAEFRRLTKGIQETTCQLEDLKQAYTKNLEDDKIERASLQANQGQFDSIEAQLTPKKDAIRSLELNKIRCQEILEKEQKDKNLLDNRLLQTKEEIKTLESNLKALQELKKRKISLDREHEEIDGKVKSMQEYVKHLENLHNFSKEKFDQAQLHEKLKHLAKIIDTLEKRGVDIQKLKNECTSVADKLIKLRTEGLISISKESQEQESLFTMKENVTNRIINFISDGLMTENDLEAYKEKLEKEKLKERDIKTEQDLIKSQKSLKLYDRLANGEKTKMKEALKFVQQKLKLSQIGIIQIDANTLKEMSDDAREYLKHSLIFLNAQKAAKYEKSLQYHYHYRTIEREIQELLPKLDNNLIKHLETVKKEKNQRSSERAEITKSMHAIAEQAKAIFPSDRKESLAAKIQRCESSIHAKQGERKNLEQQLARKQKSLPSLKANLTRSDAKLKQERANVQELESQQTELKQKITSNLSKLGNIASEKLQLAREIGDLGKAIQKLSNEQKLVNIGKDKENSTVDSYEHIIQQLEQYTSAIDGFSSEKAHLAGKIEKYKQSIDQIKGESNKLHLKIKKDENSIQQLEKKQRNKNRQIKKDQLYIEKAQALKLQAEQKAASIEQEKKEAGETLDTLKREMEQLHSASKQYHERVIYKRNDETIDVPARKVGYFDEQGVLQIGKMTQEGQLIGKNQTLIYLYSHLWDNLYCVGSSRSTRWNG